MTENSEWFAVLKDQNDADWNLGSYNPNEAIEMSKQYDPNTVRIVEIKEGKIVDSFRPLWVYALCDD